MVSYPIDNILSQLKEAVLKNSSVVLHAPPGAGKTTRVPLALLNGLTSPRGRIIMLEPRRIAAVSAARWMAQSLNEQPGETVGYTIRFDSKVSSKTRIEVVTEGILTRRIQSDPGLENVEVVIFDEFHERSIHADLALALCLDVRKQLRPDLKILVMSATLDCGPIASMLGNAKVISTPGKAFAVEERYLETRRGPLPSVMASAIRTAVRETRGDVLAFLPGAGEIRGCARELQESLDLAEERISLHPLYGDLPFDEQERAIMPSRDRRKIVLATNIAETSLTIEDVHVVIDSGLTRRLRYDPPSGMNRLVTIPVSKASAEQRKGRAGRLGPGVCYRLYQKHELEAFLPFTRPEILESDLSALVLELSAWGVKDPSALAWLDGPPSSAWNSGVRLLRELGAVDAAGSITACGREMVRLPLHPRLSRLMVRAAELGCVRLGAQLAAIISERDLFRKSASDGNSREPDLTERLEMFRAWEQGKEIKESADAAALRAVERAVKQLLRLVTAKEDRADNARNEDETTRLLLSAFPDRICKRRGEGKAEFVLVQGRGVRLSPGSHLINDPYIIAVAVDAGEKADGFIHVAARVTEDAIRQECATNISIRRRIEWDHKEGRIIAAAEERLGAFLLSQKQFTPSDEETASILCELIRSSPGMLALNDEARQFQARTSLMRDAFPEETWPDLSEEKLRLKPEEWLLPWLGGIRTAQALRELNILPALKAKLSNDQQRLLDKRAPAAITVRSGSRIRIDYASGIQPVLAVKLQEMFGLADTPAVAGGRVKILLHLLSPAGRPMQVTQDLKSFWNTGYPLVKKDLKGRYPKHPWPDDPWNAVPTKRTKPRGK